MRADLRFKDAPRKLWAMRRQMRTQTGRLLLLTLTLQIAGTSCLTPGDENGVGPGGGLAADEETQLVRAAITVNSGDLVAWSLWSTHPWDFHFRVQERNPSGI
jgi:hypothetical protein